MPDIDVDFCFERRDEVIRYVREKYGADRVAQIITFGTLKGKAAIKDVGRVLDFTFAETDRIAKLYPGAEAGEGLPARAGARDGAAAARDARRGRARARALRLRAPPRRAPAPRLEARRRHRHLRPAAHRGRAALGRQGRRRRDAVHVHRRRGDRPHQVRLPRPEDADAGRGRRAAHPRRARRRRSISDGCRSTTPSTYKLLAGGDTVGVFQMESGGMRKLLTQLKPEPLRGPDRRPRALPSRPARQRHGRAFIKRKHGKETIRYLHPRARADPEGDLRRHRLPGAGDADRPGARRLLARRRRQPAPRDGQEEEGGDGSRARALPRRRRGAGHGRREARGRDLRPDGDLRGVRLQQDPLRRLRAHHLPDRLPEGPLPDGVHGRAAVARDGRHRQHLQEHRRVPRPRHRRPAARREREPATTSRWRANASASGSAR